MASLSRELVILILQFLDEEKYKESVHKLEQESGSYFNMKYFEEEVQNGNWDVVEKYLSGFTKVEDNRYSMKMFFEIRKQKYLEALDKNDKAKAVEILVKDLKVFSSFNDELFKEITQLLALENFRENEQLSKYGDAKSARAVMLIELKKLIEANPIFREKLQFPVLKNSRLRTLINQSLNWQHQLCKNPKPNPDIKTLFVDHSCGQQSNGALVNSPASNPLLGAFPQGPFPSLTVHGSYHSTPAHAPVPTPLAGWMSNQPAVTHPSISCGPIGLAGPSNHVSFLKHPRIPSSNFTLDFPSADSGHQSKRARTIGMPDEMNPPINLLSANHSQSHNQATHSYDDLPKTVARTLNQGSKPMSMNFHPIQQTLLLVGTSIGDVCLWDVGTKERLLMTSFKVWEPVKCSLPLQNALVKDPGVSVNSLRWSSDGNLFGVAYSKHLAHIYSYNGRDDIKQHLEIEAHLGGVNDIAFSIPFKKLCFVTCGDDRTVKVWEAATGTELYTFEGHGAPVYSLCPHSKANIKYIFSTTIDGKIKAWLYDNKGSRVNHEAPGRCCSAMAYSADGSRLFLCGTSKEGESHIVEWNAAEGAVKKTYQGFRKRSVGVVQFDISRSQYLAAGDEFAIKIWHVDNPNILANIDAEGGLPASPKLRFNKEGTLLAVSTADNGIKILANVDGLRLLRTFESRIIDPYLLSESSTMPIFKSSTTAAVASSSGVADRDASTIISVMNGENRNLIDVNPRIPDESLEEPKTWKFTEINEPAQCRSLRLVHNMRSSKISRLIYTNSGAAILALASNAVHLLWKWTRNDHNSSGKATVTASLAPQLWQPPSGIIMTNDTAGVKPEEAVSCFALSKNDSYVMSASGGKISLFNMMTFKTMTTFMSPPPPATFLVFHPQDNNIIAIGMDDSTIRIYNARVDEVKSKLIGHSKRITGLAFSRKLNILISSGADSQLFAWNMDGWEKLRNKNLQIPQGRTPNPVSDTKVQFHMDQIHFLVVHEAQLAIFDANNFECIKQWVTPENSAPIAHAVISCDSQLIYASFLDATVCVFAASNLKPISRISPSAYIPANVGSSVFPVEIAAHPSEPNQFALGLTDGGVYILEPLEAEGKWGLGPPSENVSSNGMPSSSNAAAASTSTAAAAASSDQPHSQR